MGANTRWFVFVLGPHAQAGDVQKWVGIFRLIQRHRQRAGDLSCNRHERAGWNGGGIEELFLQSDEAALGFTQIRDRLGGGRQRQLQNLDPGSFLEPFRRQDFSAESDGLAVVCFGCRLYLHVGDLR